MVHDQKKINPDASDGNNKESAVSRFILPFTPKSVVSFKDVKPTVFLLNWLFYACLCAFFIAYTVERTVITAISRGITRLPQTGEIVSGNLNWRTNEVSILVESKFISFSVNPTDNDDIADSADVQVVFGKSNVRLRSMFGWVEIKYPRWLSIPLNFKQLWPLWGAYLNATRLGVFVCSVIFLVLIWLILALVYSPPTKFFIRLFKRTADSKAVFKICCAALIPGALVMGMALVTYSFMYIDLITLLIVFVFHFIIGWVYIFLSIFQLPEVTSEPENPFSPESSDSKDEKQNPFAG